MENLDMKRKVVIMLAIFTAMLFVALNQTIIGTALPRIVSDLGDMAYFNWVFTVFMLASSISAVLVGKLSDIYGRKPFVLAGLSFFIVGSFLCGLADSMLQLIIYRAIQGIGGGMIISTAFSSIGDLFSPRDRGRWQGMMGAVFGVASVLGPTLGGYIVDTTDWSWVFWIFLPFGFIALATIIWLFPSTAQKQKEAIDYLGSICLTLTIVPMLLAFSLAGSETGTSIQLTWGSLPIIGMFVVSAVSLVAFIFVESRTASAVLPLDLFRNPIFVLSNGINFVKGVGMFATLMFMPFYLQGVLGTSATVSGFLMIPMTLSLVAASAVCGQWMTKKGTYKKAGTAGICLMSAGMLCMSTMSIDTSLYVTIVYMIVVGAGLGCSFPVYTLTIQNAFSHKRLGVATASVQLFRQLGGTIGVAIMGTVLNIQLANRLSGLATQSTDGMLEEIREGIGADWEQLQSPQILMNPDEVEGLRASLDPGLQDAYVQFIASMRVALNDSLSIVFLVGALIMIVAIFLSLFIEEIPLRTSNEETLAKREDESSALPAAQGGEEPEEAQPK